MTMMIHYRDGWQVKTNLTLTDSNSHPVLMLYSLAYVNVQNMREEKYSIWLLR